MLISDAVMLAVDVALGVLAIEIIALLAARDPASVALRPMLATAMSGLFLLLALRGALVDAPPALIMAALALGGVAHAVDLTTALRRHRSR